MALYDGIPIQNMVIFLKKVWFVDQGAQELDFGVRWSKNWCTKAPFFSTKKTMGGDIFHSKYKSSY